MHRLHTYVLGETDTLHFCLKDGELYIGYDDNKTLLVMEVDQLSFLKIYQA